MKQKLSFLQVWSNYDDDDDGYDDDGNITSILSRMSLYSSSSVLSLTISSPDGRMDEYTFNKLLTLS